ncbi:hypothetical protein BJ508DRAFT_324230 [Ascobolus immersus RN42]|uniref:Uncharacterized protein n=1 Tax=Ascobolus immersus RN42 TaxID=1160509 RepID=A0A3N4II96_ASCIM|nr:hypothetical protein BJ508DRAFT_324230 [Ascobolus immersus RN42]
MDDSPSTVAFTPASSRAHSRRSSISSQISDLTLTPRIGASMPLPIEQTPKSPSYREFHIFNNIDTMGFDVKQSQTVIEFAQEANCYKLRKFNDSTDKENRSMPWEDIAESLEKLCCSKGNSAAALVFLERLMREESARIGITMMLSYLEVRGKFCDQAILEIMAIELKPSDSYARKFLAFSSMYALSSSPKNEGYPREFAVDTGVLSTGCKTNKSTRAKLVQKSEGYIRNMASYIKHYGCREGISGVFLEFLNESSAHPVDAMASRK